MVARPRLPRRSPRSGMTLLEVLLTLCLLVILAALTWPALGQPLAVQRLRAAADQLRTEWVHARVQAMSTGRPYVFRYTLDTDTYTIEPLADGEDGLDGFSGVTGDDIAAMADQPFAPVSRQRRLPDRIRFVAGQSDRGAAGPETIAASMTPASTELGTIEPIFFYPDGSCSDAQVRLENEYQRTIDLWLRGLTGVVTVGEVQSAERLGP